jgi:hypothetical protein
MLMVVSDMTKCGFDSQRLDTGRRNGGFFITLLSRRVLRPADTLGLLFDGSTNVHAADYPFSSTVKNACNLESVCE